LRRGAPIVFGIEEEIGQDDGDASRYDEQDREDEQHKPVHVCTHRGIYTRIEAEDRVRRRAAQTRTRLHACARARMHTHTHAVTVARFRVLGFRRAEPGSGLGYSLGRNHSLYVLFVGIKSAAV